MLKLSQAIRDPALVARSIRYRLASFWKTHISRDEFHVALARWYADDGDGTLRLNYPLDDGALVLDLGGYMGDFTQNILEKFGCRVLLFEPSPKFFLACQERFKADPRVSCFNFALSDHDGEEFLSTAQDGSSIKGQRAQNGEPVAVRRISSFLHEQHIENIDLIKINIEGGEFDVLPDLIDSGLLRTCRHIQVQFHDFIPGARQMRTDIRESMRKTHVEAWSYPFVWESWTRRPDNA